MATVLERLPLGARVAVIRLRSLGDCVLSTPALHILKDARPDLRVGVVAEGRFRYVFHGNPDVETILPPEVSPLRAYAPDLCWNLHGGPTSAWLTALSGAKLRAGFGHFRFARLYNVKIPRAQEILGEDRKVHTAEHMASAVFYFGAPRVPIPRARLFAGRPIAERPYAVIHAVATDPAKTWTADGFLAVAGHLERTQNLEPIFIGGPGEDLGRFAPYHRVTGAPLSEVKSLLAGASLFVGNDSGPAHMAAAFGCPVVVIFGSSDAEVWYPWQASAAELIRDPAGIRAVSAESVIQALGRLRVRA
jgi:heptosyltransferase III